MTKHILPSSLRPWIRRQLRRAGFDIVPFPRLRLLQQHGVTLLLDVGASEGLYGEEMRALGYTGRIVSFEPRSEAFARLAARAASDDGWEALPFALGREPMTSVIHLSGTGDSSSLMQMLPRHTEAAPGTGYVGEETIEVRPLDDVLRTYRRPGDVIFLKMDVQGYEQHVIDGAAQSLGYIVGIQMELSFEPLYDGDIVFGDMVRHLAERGFTLMSLEPGFRDTVTDQLLQADGLFYRLP